MLISLLGGCPIKDFLDQFKFEEENIHKRNIYYKIKARIKFETEELKGQTRRPISAPIVNHRVNEIIIDINDQCLKHVRILFCLIGDKILLTNGFEKPFGTMNSKIRRFIEAQYELGDYYCEKYIINNDNYREYDF